jgi:hypothetical protein
LVCILSLQHHSLHNSKFFDSIGLQILPTYQYCENLLYQFSGIGLFYVLITYVEQMTCIYTDALKFKMSVKKDPDKFFMSITQEENNPFDYFRALYGKFFHSSS